MKVYTKTGDKGTTTRYDGTKVPKDDSLIVAVSKIDSFLGALDSCIVSIKNEEILEILEKSQKKLWQTAGEVSLGGKGKKVKDEITEKDIEKLEEHIDKYQDDNNMFMRFRTEPSVRLNETRIRCRELEVVLTPFLREDKLRPEIYRYINRLSDLLFVLACFYQK